jgi:hypothetical protein
MSSDKQRKPHPDSESFDALGQTWHVAPIGPDHRRRFARWVRQKAALVLLEDREELGEEGFQEALSRFDHEKAAGTYSWDPPPELGGAGMGDAVATRFGTLAGKCHLLQLLLEQAHGEVSPATVWDIVASNPSGVALALRGALGLALAPAKEDAEADAEDGDPNAQDGAGKIASRAPTP